MNYGHLISKKDVDICELRKMYNIVDDYVNTTLPRRGRWRFLIKDIPDNDRNKMVKMYYDGYDTYTIGKAFDMSYKQIVSILDKKGVQRIYSAGKRKYTLNEHYFDEIDTPNKAYILGFLYADGWNDVDKNVITLSLQEGDKSILDDISREIGSNKPLRYIHCEHHLEKYGLHTQNQYRLTVSSHIMSQALSKHGCVKDKSLILKFPILRDNLYSHFLRGYFDGDGSICKSVRNDGKKDNYTVSLVSTYDFVVDAQKCIIDHLHIPGGGITETSAKNSITSSLTICGKQQTKILMDWLYRDADLFLSRKHERYLSYYYEDNSQIA